MGTIKQDDYPPDLLGLWAARVARERQATLVVAFDEEVGPEPLRASLRFPDGTRRHYTATRHEASVAIGLIEQDEAAEEHW